MFGLGHFAAGYLAGELASFTIPSLNQPKYLFLTSLFGIIPDFDFLFIFAKNKNLTLASDLDHRKFRTHAPLLYLAIFLLIYFLFPSLRLLDVTFIIGTSTHFIIDSFSAAGIPWLYPFTKKLYFVPLDKKVDIQAETTAIDYWKAFFITYFKTYAFKAEIILTILAIIVFLLNN